MFLSEKKKKGEVMNVLIRREESLHNVYMLQEWALV